MWKEINVTHKTLDGYILDGYVLNSTTKWLFGILVMDISTDTEHHRLNVNPYGNIVLTEWAWIEA